MSSLCVLGDDCSTFDNRYRTPGATNGFNLCDSCHARCAGEVAGLVCDYVDLSQRLPRPEGNSEAKISRPKPGSTPPIDLDISTLRSEIAVTLVSCEIVLRRRVGLPQRVYRHAREGYNVDRAARVVVVHLETLAGLALLPEWAEIPQACGQTPGADALLHLRLLHRRARRLCGLSTLKIGLPGYCEKCKLAQLSRLSGSDTVTCAACHHSQPWQEYQRRVTLTVSQISGQPRE